MSIFDGGEGGYNKGGGVIVWNLYATVKPVMTGHLSEYIILHFL